MRICNCGKGTRKCVFLWPLNRTYHDLKPLAEVGDLEHLLLKLLYHLILIFSSFLRCVGDGADLLSLCLVFVVELLVMLGEVAEGLTRGCLDLERFDLLESISAVHTFYDSVYIAKELFFEYFRVL